MCLDCGRLTSGRSRCRSCSVKREQAKQERSPWLRLYHLPEWNVVKWQVHHRDGYRCTFHDARGRCTRTRDNSTIEAHHMTKVVDLYRESRGWDQFLSRALDHDQIVTLCYRHHVQADRPGRRLNAEVSARPRTVRKGTAAPKSRTKHKRRRVR